MKLSFVIPCYRSEKTILKVIDEITSVIDEKNDVTYEIVCVNDCSPDNVINVLKDIANQNKNVKVIDFMRNFGKDSAIMAGLASIDGDIAVIMDDDYQCPAYEVWKLIEPIETESCDVTTALYDEKRESMLKRVGSDVQMICAQSMLGQPKGVRIENFIAMNKLVYREILNYKNSYPFLDGLIMRVSKRIVSVPMSERNRGDDNKTGFTFIKSLKMFADGLTAFSVKPLRVATIMGFITACIGMIYLIFTVLFYFFGHEYVAEGYSSLMSVILFVGGMLMMMIGMVGEYVGRIYICINQSPQYVIRQRINFD